MSLQEELPSLGPCGVLVQVRACALISPAEERASRELLRGVCTTEDSTGISRLFMGQDVAGIVRAIGSDVSTLQVGDDVVGMTVVIQNRNYNLLPFFCFPQV